MMNNSAFCQIALLLLFIVFLNLHQSVIAENHDLLGLSLDPPGEDNVSSNKLPFVKKNLASEINTYYTIQYSWLHLHGRS